MNKHTVSVSFGLMVQEHFEAKEQDGRQKKNPQNWMILLSKVGPLLSLIVPSHIFEILKWVGGASVSPCITCFFFSNAGSKGEHARVDNIDNTIVTVMAAAELLHQLRGKAIVWSCQILFSCHRHCGLPSSDYLKQKIPQKLTSDLYITLHYHLVELHRHGPRDINLISSYLNPCAYW